MIKIFVDSGSSIKQEEKEAYGIEIFPLRFLMGEDKEYRDGIDMTVEEFYDKLINEKLFPKTSLPMLDEIEEKVTECTKNGDDVIIITISSGISGTNAAIKSMFKDNDKVVVVDSLCAVGGIRILVEEINKYREESLAFVMKKINELIPRLRVCAIPETLDYLLRGGRLSKKEWMLGSILNIKPIINLDGGVPQVEAKKIGLRGAMKYVLSRLVAEVDTNYSIVPSYTYNADNLNKLMENLGEELKAVCTAYDNLDPVIACHWGPNAFGFIYVKKA